MTIAQSRRQMMQLLGIAPLATATAATEMKALLASPTVKAGVLAAGAMGADQNFPQPFHSPLMKTLGKAVFQQAEDLAALTDQQYWIMQRGRVNGLDADLGALKSCSHGFKARKQIERDTEVQRLLFDFQSMKWGKSG